MSSHLLLFTPSMLHACFAFFPLPNIFVNHIYLRLLFFPRLTNSMSCVTGYSSHAILAMEQHGKDLANSVMERAEAICKDFKTTNMKKERVVGCGDAKDVICSAVQKLEADTLVLGTHGYGFFKRALIGSVSDYCAKHAECTVVVVKQPCP
ncbi:Universal stress protein A-like protein [Glycine soja]